MVIFQIVKVNVNMQVEKIDYISPNGKTEMLILKPDKKAPKAPGILWLHGGGYFTGMKEMVYFSRARNLVDRFGAVVFVPGYRLSLINPFPAGFNDSISALEFIKNEADRFKINKNQLMIGGESAGGGLTVAVSLYMRDTRKVNVAFQMPLYPMLSFKDTITSKCNFRFPWNTFTNHFSWKQYGKALDKPNYYFSPSIAQDLSNLPPAYSFVGLKEPFYAETLDYFLKLKANNIQADLDVYPTDFHAFDMLQPNRKLSRQAIKRFEEYFDYALHNYYAFNK